ncbi:unnamed protein product [Adineta steineri]|uniref:Uncharacterized protein n=2 Tax=Adineta steineri TaxID=433720 RepID=A0A815MT70_9BILA|nr:unnamed protein product [Adineta steineri]
MLISLSLIFFQYLKFYHIIILRNQCQLTREKLNKIHLTTDVLDQEYYQLKQILSSSMYKNDIEERLINIENEQQRSLIDQQRIYTLEHLNRQLKNDLNASKLINESLKRRLNCTCQINNKTEYLRSYLSTQKSWPFPYCPPWIPAKLSSIHEEKPLKISSPLSVSM